jgi:hypothetical protein
MALEAVEAAGGLDTHSAGGSSQAA